MSRVVLSLENYATWAKEFAVFLDAEVPVVAVHVKSGLPHYHAFLATDSCVLKASADKIAKGKAIQLRHFLEDDVDVSLKSVTHPGRVIKDIYVLATGSEMKTVVDFTSKWLESLRKATALVVQNLSPAVLTEMEQYPEYGVARDAGDAAGVWRLLKAKLDVGLRNRNSDSVEKAAMVLSLHTIMQGESESHAEYFAKQDMVLRALVNLQVDVHDALFESILVGVTFKNMHSKLRPFYFQDLYGGALKEIVTLAKAREVISRWAVCAQSSVAFASTEIGVNKASVSVVSAQGQGRREYTLAEKAAFRSGKLAAKKRSSEYHDSRGDGNRPKVENADTRGGGVRTPYEPRGSGVRRDPGDVTCYRCNMKGHYRRDCTAKL